jgi:hypothetical protein
VTPQQELTAELRDHLDRAMADGPRGAGTRWVMSAEWLAECLLIDPWSPLPTGRPETMLGIPIEVRDDGGVPHLEAVAP